MTTLVTGASGHLGTNLVRTLVEQGQTVRVLLRPNSPNLSMQSVDVEKAYGTLEDRQSLEKAMRGCSRVYHLAAYITIRHGDQQKLYDVNVIGSRTVFQTALKMGVERVVYCSSFGAIGNNPNGACTEAWIVNPFEELSSYEITKTFGEYEALRAVVQGLPVTIVNPSAIVGPWDYGPSLLGKTILDFARGKLKAYVPGAFDFVPVRDVVQGLIGAMDKGAAGERYLLTGEVVTLNQIFTWLSESTGVPKPRIKIPFALIRKVARVKDAIEKRFFPNITPRFTYNSIRHLNSGKYGDSTRAQKELGYQPTSVKEAFLETAAWFDEHGYLQK